jgi:hypothetical protein
MVLFRHLPGRTEVGLKFLDSVPAEIRKRASECPSDLLPVETAYSNEGTFSLFRVVES